MWSPTISSDELYHHGILKMKWGVRNGPPYPLQPSQHSAAEKRAMGKKKRLSDIAGRAYVSANKMALKSSIDNAKSDLRRFNKASEKYGGGDLLRPSYEKKVKKREKEYEEYSKKHQGLTDEDKAKLKKAAIGAAIVGGVALGAYAAYKLNDPDFKTIVKAARANKSVDDYIKSMSDAEISKLAFNTKTQNLKISLNEARGMSPTAARKLVGRSDIQSKAWHEMTDRQMILDRLDAKAAGGYDKIERFTGGSQFMENAKRGKKAGNLAAQRLAEEAKKAKENTVYEKFKNNPNVKVYKNGLDMGRNAQNVNKSLDTAKSIASKTISNNTASVANATKKTSEMSTKAIKNTVSNVKETTKKVASSGPKLEFGGPSSSSSSDVMERLIRNSMTYSNMANQTKKDSSKSTGQKDYTEQLLNKNGGKLKNMTMDDLKKT